VNTPLGTSYDEHCRSWVVIRIGTGYIIEPRSVGQAGPWSHYEGFCALLREQGGLFMACGSIFDPGVPRYGDGPLSERIGFADSIYGKRASRMYYTTGFSVHEIEDLCALRP